MSLIYYNFQLNYVAFKQESEVSFNENVQKHHPTI